MEYVTNLSVRQAMNTITAYVPLRDGVFTIAFDNGVIDSVTASDERTDLCVGPALFDIQVNGYAGHKCCSPHDDDPGALSAISEQFHANGIGWWIPTVVTNSHDALHTTFRQLAAEMEANADLDHAIPGFHLEGPYISPDDGARGAHPADHVRPPDWDEFCVLQEAAGGRIRLCTLAPETAGAGRFIAQCVESGVRVAIGHTNLTRQALTEAVSAGATMCTHLGNGAHDMLQRHENYFWYQLADRTLYASFITDNQHLPDECAYSLIHAKGLDRSILTSDCVHIAGLPPGRYSLGAMDVELLDSGRIVLPGTPNLAGSASNLRECTENAIRVARLSHADGWRLASEQPARVFGLDARLGVEAGREATLTVYRYESQGPKIDVVETWLAGRRVYAAGD